MARKANRFKGITIRDELVTPSDGIVSVRYKVALYARISVEIKGNPSNSVENQLEIMKNYTGERAEFADFTEYVDIGVSGTTFERLAFKQMMEDVKAGNINCILVKDLSRFGRFYIETSNYIETIFPFLGVRFISINDHFDSDVKYNQNKALEVALKNLANDIYAKDVSKRVACSRKLDMKKGKFVGSNAPYGYRVDVLDPNRRYVIDEASASVIRQIFEMALSGLTLRNIAKQLEVQQLSSPGEYLRTQSLHCVDNHKKSRWYTGTISSILKNQAYIGMMVQGKRRTSLNENKKQEKTSVEDWIVVEHAHESIVEKVIFEQVRILLEKKVENSTFSSERGKKIPMKNDMFLNIIYCGECGRKLQLSSRLTEKKNDLERQYYYQCRYGYDIDKRTCKVGAWLEEELVQVIYDALSAVIATQNTRKMIIELDQLTLRRVGEYDSKINRMEKEIKQEEYQAGELYEAYIMGELSKDDLRHTQDNSGHKIEKLNKQVTELITEKGKIEKLVSKEKRWWKTAAKLKGKASLNRELIEIMIKRIDVYPEKSIQITYNFSNPINEKS